MSIFSGYLFKDIVAGYGISSSVNLYSEFSLDRANIAWVEFLNPIIKFILVFVGFSGYLFYFFVYKKVIDVDLIFEKSKLIRNLYSFFYNRWYVDAIISSFFSYFFLIYYEETNLNIIQIRFLDYFSTKTVIM